MADLPTTPCSVIWSDGHPFVLDGEPGISPIIAPRRWVGLSVVDQPLVLTADEMRDYGFSVVYVDPGEDRPPVILTGHERQRVAKLLRADGRPGSIELAVRLED